LANVQNTKQDTAAKQGKGLTDKLTDLSGGHDE